MQCNDIQEKLSAYIDGDISSEERMLIDEHLKSCEQCNKTLAEMKKTTEYVRDLGDIEPPAWLTQKIMTKIRSEAGKEKSIWRKLFYPLHIKLPVEAAVAVLLAVTTIYIFKTMQPEMKLAKAPVEEMTSRIPLKETKSTDKDLMSRKNDIVSGKAPQVYQHQTAPLETTQSFVQKEKAVPSAGAVAKDESQQRALSPAPALRALAESKKESLYLTVHIQDIKKAREDIVKFVTQLNGEITKTESFADKDVLRVTLSSKQLKSLIEKLRLIGRMEEKEKALEGYEGDREITLEIVKIQH
ncbi:MAG: DUF2275 domain-containing protein [Nitrospira sp.]|nr:DUF2275 domain-containing protein [Nitrospira sp.]